MGVIAEDKFIEFLKNIFKPSNQKDNDSIISENLTQQSIHKCETISDIINVFNKNNIINNEQEECDYSDEEYYFENVSNEIIELVKEEMANEDIPYDNLDQTIIKALDKLGIYDKLYLLELNIINLAMKTNNTVFNKIVNLQELIKQEFLQRVKMKYYENKEDD